MFARSFYTGINVYYQILNLNIKWLRKISELRI